MIEACIFLFGVVLGSFLNVLVDRIPRGEDVIWKPSHCEFCKKTLRWFELLPVVSFVLQRGRCLRCNRRLSFEYPVMELATAAGLFVLYTHASTNWFLVPLILIFCSFLVMGVIDYKHQILPDSLLLILFASILILAIPVSPALRFSHVLTAVAAGLAFLALWFFTRGKGIGFGDVKLVTLLGLLFGYPHTIIALYIAFLTGAGVGVILIMTHQARMKSRIAFGPFLIIGAVCAWIWGENILSWWMSLL